MQSRSQCTWPAQVCSIFRQTHTVSGVYSRSTSLVVECMFPDNDSIIHALKLLQCQLLRYASNNSKMSVGWRTEQQLENLAVVHGHKIVQVINLTVTNHMYVCTYVHSSIWINVWMYIGWRWCIRYQKAFGYVRSGHWLADHYKS